MAIQSEGREMNRRFSVRNRSCLTVILYLKGHPVERLIAGADKEFEPGWVVGELRSGDCTGLDAERALGWRSCAVGSVGCRVNLG